MALLSKICHTTSIGALIVIGRLFASNWSTASTGLVSSMASIFFLDGIFGWFEETARRRAVLAQRWRGVDHWGEVERYVDRWPHVHALI